MHSRHLGGLMVLAGKTGHDAAENGKNEHARHNRARRLGIHASAHGFPLFFKLPVFQE
jgi:hypothetical protein